MQIKGQKWLLLGMGWFVSIAILGILMRYMYISDFLNIKLKNILHTHSHVALLGWVYTAIFVGIIDVFLKKQYKDFKAVFYFTQVTVLGMLISFPIQGYGVFSISFSTLFLFASYWFIWLVFKKIEDKDKHLISTKFLKAGLWYLIISSIGPWALGPVMAMGYKHQPLYHNTIYFFLHFLYNGFIVMIIMSFIYRIIEKESKNTPHYGKWTYRLLQLSIIPSYLLSTYWTFDITWVHIIGGVSAILLFTSLFPFVIDSRRFLSKTNNNKWIKYSFSIAIFSYIIKLIFQLISAIPNLAPVIYTNRMFLIIGYLHLVLLGFVSLFFITWFVMRKLFNFDNILSKSGIVMFVLGIILSEIMLFYQGSTQWTLLPHIPDYTRHIVLASSPILIGLSLFFIGQFRKSD